MNDTITINPAPFPVLVSMTIGAVGLTVGVAAILLGLFGPAWLMETGWWIVAGIAVASGLLALGLTVLSVSAGRPCIEIGPDGFTFRPALAAARTRRWADIDGDFKPFKLGFAPGVAYRLTPAYKELHPIKPNPAFDGNDEAIAGSYQISIEDLAILLNEHKGRAGKSCQATDR